MEILTRLAGRWGLERRIEGHASMKGTTDFSWREDGRLSYLERGVLQLVTGDEFETHRRYLFEQRADGFVVHFAEDPPRVFHKITLEEKRGTLFGEADHLCNHDLYQSSYEFHLDGSFSIRHDVYGPRKDYEMVTVYRRPTG